MGIRDFLRRRRAANDNKQRQERQAKRAEKTHIDRQDKRRRPDKYGRLGPPI